MADADAEQTGTEIHVANNEPVALPGLEPPVDDAAGAEGSDATHTPAGTEASAPAASELLPVEVVEGMVSASFDMIAARRGEHWRLDEDEARNIAEPLAGELNEFVEHAPFLGGAVAAVGGRRVQLVAALGFAVGPRLMADAALARQVREATTREAAHAHQATRGGEPDDLAARLQSIPRDDELPDQGA